MQRGPSSCKHAFLSAAVFELFMHAISYCTLKVSLWSTAVHDEETRRGTGTSKRLAAPIDFHGGESSNAMCGWILWRFGAKEKERT
jgi:hypothetical protein